MMKFNSQKNGELWPKGGHVLGSSVRCDMLRSTNSADPVLQQCACKGERRRVGHRSGFWGLCMNRFMALRRCENHWDGVKGRGWSRFLLFLSDFESLHNPICRYTLHAHPTHTQHTPTHTPTHTHTHIYIYIYIIMVVDVHNQQFGGSQTFIFPYKLLLRAFRVFAFISTLDFQCRAYMQH